MTSQPETVTPQPFETEYAALHKVSVQEYFAIERATELRHEYLDGVVIAMAGETPTHNRIARNICVRLEVAFEDRNCETFIENIRTRVSPSKYRYPDIAALCGEAQFDTETPPSLLNPTLIVEVLSPSTQSVDRNDKFSEYRQLETVTDYVLVAQDQSYVMHYARQTESQWIFTIHSNLNARLTFASLEVAITLADIYRKIVFAPSR